jgi:hypothetical protein
MAMRRAAGKITILWMSFALVFGWSALAGADDSGGGPVTFHRDIAPIFQQNCQTCHRPGDVAPMSLVDYRDARPWAKAVRQAVTARTMPPWFADAAYGHFDNDTSLSEEEIATIVRWVDQGAPEGNPAEAPAPIIFDHEGWKLKEPDLILRYPEPYVVGKEVDDEYRCFVVKLPEGQDLWLKGAEYEPGNRSVVHHFIVFIDPTEESLQMDLATPEPGYECGMGSGNGRMLRMVGAWAPGNNPMLSDPGVAQKIPAGSYAVIQAHYHNTTGADQVDHSRVALHVARPDEVIVKDPQIQLVSAWRLNIAPGDPASQHEARWNTRRDVTVHSIAPHMHYRGKAMTVFAQLPGEEERTLLHVPRYDFNWQISYRLSEPLKAPAGTKFRMASIHDNSADNPANPDPTVEVGWGEETHNEMAIAFLGVTLDEQNLNIVPKWDATETVVLTDPGAALPAGEIEARRVADGQ